MKPILIDKVGKLWNRFSIGLPGSLRFDILSAAYRLFPLMGGIDYPRLIEWNYVLNRLPRLPAKVIDVGSTTSLFPFKLNAMGYETHCLDYRPPVFKLPEKITFHHEDLMNIPMAFDTFDAVSCISVVEHVGLGKYNDPLTSDDGDILAVKELLRILKPGGSLLATTNISACTRLFNNEIRYGKNRLNRLLACGEILDIRYFSFDKKQWRQCSETEGFDQVGDNFGLAAFELGKPAVSSSYFRIQGD